MNEINIEMMNSTILEITSIVIELRKIVRNFITSVCQLENPGFYDSECRKNEFDDSRDRKSGRVSERLFLSNVKCSDF